LDNCRSRNVAYLLFCVKNYRIYNLFISLLTSHLHIFYKVENVNQWPKIDIIKNVLNLKFYFAIFNLLSIYLKDMFFKANKELLKHKASNKHDVKVNIFDDSSNEVQDKNSIKSPKIFTDKPRFLHKKNQTFTIETFFSSILIIFLLWLAFSLSKSLWQTISNQTRIIKENEERDKLSEEVVFLQEKLSYLKSESYIEEEGRNKLGLAKDGEKVLIIPEDTLNEIEASLEEDTEFSVKSLSVWEQWFKFFF